jgi:hypothetical protein
VASILTSTKKVLGLDASYTVFDLDVTTHINAAFSTVNQLGVGPEDGFFIEDATEDWDDLDIPANQLHLVKTYIYLKVKMLFDPPGTSFHISAMEEQIRELEWRINMLREVALPDPEEVAP